jgi:hypothetical protein
MANRKALVVCGMLLIFSIVSLTVPSTPAQVKGVKKGQWIQENKFGFPVWMAANYVIDASAFSHRHIYMFIETLNFNEKNILSAFTSLAEEFKVPDDLSIYAYSDRAALQRALDEASSGVLCIMWADSPEGRRASRNYDLKTNPHRSGYYRAEYYRRPNGRESWIKYSPEPDQEHLKTLYHKNPSFNYSDPTKDFISAAGHGDAEAIKRLLAQDLSADLLKAAGDKALREAASNGQADVVNILLDAGVAAKSDGGNRALIAAAIDGNAEIVQDLLDRGADANARTGSDKDELDDSALMLAARHGHLEVIKALLAKGAKVDDRNRFGETALMQAMLAEFPEIVRLLVAKGSDVNARDVNGQTALMLAGDDQETIETLLNLGADFKASDTSGTPALMLAIFFRESAKADALIKRGAGKESIEAAKRYIAAPPPKKGIPPNVVKEEGYCILTEIYVKLGMKKEAAETGQQMLEVFGDQAHLRARLGFTYLAIGDKAAALAQYEILQDRAAKAQDKDTKRSYQDWAASLRDALNQ